MIHKIKLILPILLVSGTLLWADEVDSTRLVCPMDERITCVEILEKIADLKQSITECCAELQTCLEETNSLIDSIVTPSCAVAMAISQADMPFTITASGQYCLQETVTGTLTIDADDVSLNMNGFMISGGSTNNIVATGHTNITIANGAVGDAGVSGNGILLTTCTTVSIFNVNFQDSQTGCHLVATTNIRIHGCSFSEHQTGLLFEQSLDGKITCCQMDQTQFNVSVDTSRNLNFFDIVISTTVANSGGVNVVDSENCIFNTISVVASNGVAVSQSSSLLFYNSKCVHVTDGIITDSTTDVAFVNCSANGGTNGYFLNEDTRLCLLNCSAIANSNHGFQLISQVDSYLFNNKALNNGIRGFYVSAAGTEALLRNYAQSNGAMPSTDNYVGFPVNYSITTFNTAIGTGVFNRNAGGGLPRPTDWDNISVI